MVTKLEIARVEQQASLWCWAACGEMIAQWFHRSLPQCEIVNRTFSVGTACTNPSSANVPLNVFRIESALAGVGLRNTAFGGRLSIRQIVTELGAQRPILASVSLGAAGSNSSVVHVVVINGYSDDGAQPMVYRLDPFPGAGGGWIGLQDMDWGLSWAQFHV